MLCKFKLAPKISVSIDTIGYPSDSLRYPYHRIAQLRAYFFAERIFGSDAFIWGMTRAPEGDRHLIVELFTNE